jgi:hypothetical protein
VGGIIVFPATAVGVIAALATRHSIVVESISQPADGNGAPAASSESSAVATLDAASPYGGQTVNPPLPPDSAPGQLGGAPD